MTLVADKKFQPMGQKQSELFISCVVAEQAEKKGKKGWNPPKEEEWPVLCKIIKSRISVMELPIKFTPLALMATMALCDRPASSVILLIDALDKHEGQEITVAKLAELYPVGFYTEKALIKRVNQLKEGKGSKWAYVYKPF